MKHNLSHSLLFYLVIPIQSEMYSLFSPPQDENIEKASILAANSLLNTASFVEIFRGNESDRVELMQFVFQKNIHMVAAKEENALHYFFSDTGELECFFMLVPHSTSFSWCEQLAWGIFEIPFRCGFDAFQRMSDKSDRFAKIEAEIMKDYPQNYLHLQRMCVLPAARGKGERLYILSFICSLVNYVLMFIVKELEVEV